MKPSRAEAPLSTEQEIIDLLVDRGTPAPPGVRLGPGDDCALLEDGTAITVDAITEGIHWDHRLSPADVGYKVVAVSASDLGAMGAQPAWMVLSLSLPRPVDLDWVAAFSEGLHLAARRYGVALVGGDTTGSLGPRWVSVTMAGPCPRPVLRSGASPGQDLWLTGFPGLASAGYLLEAPPSESLAALRRPVPPVELARALARQGLATAMMDTSDGLCSDLPRLCAASGVGAEIDPERLPLHPALAREVDEPLRLQLGGGDDYQLLFTALPQHSEAVLALAQQHEVPAARVGHTDDSRTWRVRGRPWPTGWSHFSG